MPFKKVGAAPVLAVIVPNIGGLNPPAPQTERPAGSPTPQKPAVAKKPD